MQSPPQIMESAISLCYSPLAKAALLGLSNGGSKGFANASSSRFHHTLFKFNHASLCCSHFPTLHPIATRTLFPHANCFPDDKLCSLPSNNSEESNNKNNNVLRGMTGISLVLACALGLFNFNSKMNPMFSTAYATMNRPGEESEVESLMKTFAAPSESAVESLMKMIAAPSDQTRPKYERKEPSKEEVDALKRYAVSESKSGNQTKAVQILEKEYNKYIKRPEAKGNLRMALIELLIFQGKFEEARNWLDQHIDELIGGNNYGIDPEKKIEILQLDIKKENRFLAAQIAQSILYKAIVHSMLGNSEEAAKWWQAFAESYES